MRNKPEVGSSCFKIIGALLVFAVFFGCEKNPGNSGSNTVTDVDGNEYTTVKIGDQIWMAENLKVTHYRNGDAIPFVTDAAIWEALTTGACCNYNNNAGNASIYGFLYNWYAAVDLRNIAPEGWHVPSDAEWQILVNFLGGDAIAGGKLKEVGTLHWQSPNTGATNASEFTALPGGYRSDFGTFDNMGFYAFFWSTTEFNPTYGWSRTLDHDYTDVYRLGYIKPYGFSIRCVRD